MSTFLSLVLLLFVPGLLTYGIYIIWTTPAPPFAPGRRSRSSNYSTNQYSNRKQRRLEEKQALKNIKRNSNNPKTKGKKEESQSMEKLAGKILKIQARVSALQRVRGEEAPEKIADAVKGDGEGELPGFF